jgi:mRNA-degrading endonuclease YafQ of YafQ-DinJ toxin-antitoxin module
MALDGKLPLADKYQQAAEMLGEWVEFREKHIDVV